LTAGQSQGAIHEIASASRSNRDQTSRSGGKNRHRHHYPQHRRGKANKEKLSPPGDRDASGKLIPIEVKAGDRVLFATCGHDASGAHRRICQELLDRSSNRCIQEGHEIGADRLWQICERCCDRASGGSDDLVRRCWAPSCAFKSRSPHIKIQSRTSGNAAVIIVIRIFGNAIKQCARAHKTTFDCSPCSDKTKAPRKSGRSEKSTGQILNLRQRHRPA
jgi:hypothetical protein